MTLRFSIVIPTLNRKTMLLAALDSITLQETADVEIIVIDGQSTDGTQDAVAALSGVRLISGPDTGVYDAINKGVAVATGDIIGLLNSDDAYAPGAFKAVADAFETNPDTDAVCGGAVLVENDRVVATFNNSGDKSLTTSRPVFIGACIPNARFFSRQALTRVGQFQTDFRYVSDRDWLARFYNANMKTTAVSPVVYRYRQHPGSLTFGGGLQDGKRIRAELLRLARSWRLCAASRHDVHKMAALLEGRCLIRMILAELSAGHFTNATEILKNTSTAETRNSTLILNSMVDWLVQKAQITFRKKNEQH